MTRATKKNRPEIKTSNCEPCVCMVYLRMHVKHLPLGIPSILLAATLKHVRFVFLVFPGLFSVVSPNSQDKFRPDPGHPKIKTTTKHTIVSHVCA